MLEPQVTFCVPVFNAQPTLARCLQAILDQKVSNAEVLVVDNASTDDSVGLASRILASAQATRTRLVVNETNLGRIENWNRCLDLAEGRYIKFAMASDVLWTGSTQRLLAEAEGNPDVVIVASRHEWWDGSDEPAPDFALHEPVHCSTSSETLRQVLLGKNPFWALNGMLMRADAVRAKTLRFEPSIPYVADVHFCTRLAALGAFTFLPATTYWFNTGIRSRFHYAGMDARSYYGQYRVICRQARMLAAEQGEVVPSEETVLFRHYLYCLEIDYVPIDLAGVLAVFKGSPRHQVQGAFRLLWRRWLFRRSPFWVRLGALIRGTRR